MEKHEQEPQWYDTARSGPFRDRKFTEEAAGRVVRQIHPEGSGGLEQTLPAAQRRRAIRTRILSAAVILLLLGAGMLYLGMDGNGQSGGFNPSKAALGVGIFEPPVAGQIDLTDEDLKEIAEQTMQEQLGTKLPFILLERLKEPEEGIAAVHYKEGEESATVWINIETGEVIRTNMYSLFTPEEIDPEFIQEAMEKLREAGYKGKFTVTGLKHFVHYGTNDEEQGVQTDDGLIAEEGQIDYENGVYRASTYNVSEAELGAEVKQAGLRALKLLRVQETDPTDNLYSIKRTVAQEWDILVLTYGESEYGASTVLVDYSTQDIIQVADYALHTNTSYLPSISEQDTEVIKKREDELQRKAAAIADEMFGIRLEEYSMAEEMSGVGVITFKSPDGTSLIGGEYTAEGDFYMIQQTPVPSE